MTFITYIKREFVFDMWALYAAAALGHAGYDKTMASVKDFKEKKLGVEAETAGVAMPASQPSNPI